MKNVGIVGWRGMVGSVLMQRMRDEKDFAGIAPVFFSTSQAGQPGPDVGKEVPALQDAHAIDALKEMDIILTCQGGDYTTAVYQRLRDSGWAGYWIDAASTLRMADDAIIVLDPVNQGVIHRGLDRGVKSFIGGNCTVSLMLMGVGGLFRQGLVEWISPMTYQAASGAGAQNMRELVSQMGYLHTETKALLEPSASILELDKAVTAAMTAKSCPTEQFGFPLAGSLLPWIDTKLASGQSKEEWKAGVETNKILGRSQNPIPIDGLCVRVGAMRSHAQALTVKLTKDVPLDEIRQIIGEANAWVSVVDNEKEATLKSLTPAAVSGTLQVPVGRLRKLAMGGEYLSAFTVGDQLLWGAAEPLRRMLRILETS